jgi:hypothetical protein
MLILESLTEKVLGAAYEVHRVLGPGLLESTYRSYEAQTITYLKHGKFPVGLLINFNVRPLLRFLRISRSDHAWQGSRRCGRRPAPSPA